MPQNPSAGLNVVIPMAGVGSRFRDFGFCSDKFCLPLDTRLETMIEGAVVSLGCPPGTRFVFVLRAGGDGAVEDLLVRLCAAHGYACYIVHTPGLTDGPATSAYLARGVLERWADDPLIVSNSDQVLEWSFEDFWRTCRDRDGCVLTYRPYEDVRIGAPDKHSFARLDDSGRVLELKEKVVLGPDALVGVHYFRTARLFFEAYEHMQARDMRAPNGELYLSMAYQALLDLGRDVGIHRLPAESKFHPVGTPEDYFAYICGHRDHAPCVRPVQPGEPLYAGPDGASVAYFPGGVPDPLDGPAIYVHMDGVPALSDAWDGTSRKVAVIRGVRCWALPGDVDGFVRGWIIGDFVPSLVRTEAFEVGIMRHRKDERWAFHYHERSTETNVLVRGRMRVNGLEIREGDRFEFAPHQLSCPEFLEDCVVLCVKTPSAPGDKVCV